MIEHQWEELKRDKDSDIRERHCAVCDLTTRQDLRAAKYHKDRGTYDEKKSWSVHTPCIEPVPERVSYEDLVKELKAHPAKVWNTYGGGKVTKTFEDRIHCMGVPGRWRVGFSTERSVSPYHSPFAELELGFAWILRYMRARQYDPYLYSDLSYQEQLGRHDDCCSDD